MITARSHRQVFVYHLFMTTQNTSEGKKLYIKGIKGISACEL